MPIPVEILPICFALQCFVMFQAVAPMAWQSQAGALDWLGSVVGHGETNQHKRDNKPANGFHDLSLFIPPLFFCMAPPTKVPAVHSIRDTCVISHSVRELSQKQWHPYDPGYVCADCTKRCISDGLPRDGHPCFVNLYVICLKARRARHVHVRLSGPYM